SLGVDGIRPHGRSATSRTDGAAARYRERPSFPTPPSPAPPPSPPRPGRRRPPTPFGSPWKGCHDHGHPAPRALGFPACRPAAADGGLFRLVLLAHLYRAGADLAAERPVLARLPGPRLRRLPALAAPRAPRRRRAAPRLAGRPAAAALGAGPAPGRGLLLLQL